MSETFFSKHSEIEEEEKYIEKIDGTIELMPVTHFCNNLKTDLCDLSCEKTKEECPNFEIGGIFRQKDVWSKIKELENRIASLEESK